MKLKQYTFGASQAPTPVAPATTLVVPAGGSLQVTFEPPSVATVCRLEADGDVLELTVNAVGTPTQVYDAKVTPDTPFADDSTVISSLYLYNPGAVDIVFDGTIATKTGSLYGRPLLEWTP